MSQRLRFHAGGFTILFFLFINSLVTAQLLPYSLSQRSRIETVRQSLQQIRDINYPKAVAKALQLGRPVTINRPDGRVIQLHSVTERGELLYLTTYNNIRSAATTRTNSLYAGGSIGVDLSGNSASVQNRLGIWDGSRVRNTHIELRNRVTQIDNPAAISTTNENQLHATHVSGTMIATGINPLVRGMANKANLKAWDFNNDVAEATTASTTLLVSNHSYGIIAGWYYDDTRTTTVKWEWLGDTTLSPTDDYKYGFYDSDAQNWDRLVVNAPYYLPVRSAGNDHNQDHPAAGESYYLVNNGNRLSTQPRNYQTGYDQVVLAATAKNILTVGAVSSIANGYRQPSDVKLASFSAWGPTDDGRIKPDLVGVGVSVFSLSNASDSAYATLDGTSMSSPNVSGSLLLLQEYYAQLNAGKLMRASTLKGVALHTANEAGTSPGPDYQYGWGLLNVERAARVIGNGDKTNVLDERTLSQGATYTLPVIASGKGPLMVTICWTDPESASTTVTKANVNNRTPKLVNDLDVRVSDGSQTQLPWTLNPDQPTQAAVPGDNIRDNIEQVYIANPVPGKAYTITVSHKNTLRNASQDYALIVSGVGGTTYCASAASTNADSRIDRVQFSNIDKAGSGGCTTATDNTTLVADVQAGQSIPLTVTTGSCGTARNTIVKAFVDWNTDGDFDDANETVATSGVLANGSAFTGAVTVPANVTVGQFTRLRIVDVATDDATAVTACGSYAVGETQDFVLRILQVTNDVGVVAIVAPDSGFCGQSNDVILAVRIQNIGTVTQSTVPVSVSVLDQSNKLLTTLTSSFASLSANQQALVTFQLSASVGLQAGQVYRFIAATTLATDQISTNNQLTVTRTTGALPGNGIFSALDCGATSAVTLRNTGDGVATWYDAPTGGNLLAAGNLTSTTVHTANGTYYASLNEFSGRLGPATKSAFGSGSYGGAYVTQPLLSAKVPLMLSTARLYIGTPGRVTFSIKRLDETVVSTVTLDVTTTRTLPTSATATGGQLTDDPADPGAVYPLNLRIPTAGEYKLTIDYENGATIFRSTTAVAGSTITTSTFPVSLPGIISSKGSLFPNSTTGVSDTIKYAWYYLYDLQVRPLACSNGQRVAVTTTAGVAPTATITPNGSTTACQGSSVTLRTTVSSSDIYAYQWLRNGQLITGATSATYAAAVAGQYSVQVTGSCPTTSLSAVTVSLQSAVTPTITQNGIILVSNATFSDQWLFNGVAIAGATSTTYTATQSGRYSVRGNVNGCGEATSSEVAVTILAVEPIVTTDVFRIYPNPAVKSVTVEASAPSGPTPTVQLIDSRGALLQTVSMKRSGDLDMATVDVGSLPDGIFFIQIVGDTSQPIRVKRFTKQ